MEHTVEIDKLKQIRQRLGEIYARGTTLDEDGRRRSIQPGAVTEARGRFIADLMRAERPRASLEVGMAWGLSTLFILQALLEQGEGFEPHVVMDPLQHTHYRNAARLTLRELGIENLVEFYGEPSEFVLPQLARQKRRFDFAFIDGHHGFEYAFVDFRFIHLMLKPGALVVFDDANWDGVHLTCRFAESNYGYAPVAEYRPAAAHRRRRLIRPGAGRPSACAYRKPMQAIAREQSEIVPFFDGFKALPPEPASHFRHQGLLALQAGDRERARENFRIALRKDPVHFKTYLRLMRTYLPAGLARIVSARVRRSGAPS